MLIEQAMLNDGLNYSEMMDIKNKVKEKLIKEMNNDKELEKKVSMSIIGNMTIYGSEINEYNLWVLIKDLIQHSDDVRNYITENYMCNLNVDKMNELLDYRFEY